MDDINPYRTTLYNYLNNKPLSGISYYITGWKKFHLQSGI